MKIKDIIKEGRPRERFCSHGPDSLSEAELLAIILRTGTKGENVVNLANRIISEIGLTNLFDCSIEELIKIRGIGRDKAIQILTVFELSKRHSYSKSIPTRVVNAKSVFNVFKDKLKNKSKEYFYIVLTDTKNKIIKTEEISVGILDASIVHPREIFKSAIRASAARIILVHNHPSGDPTPSEEDLSVTRKLIDVGELVGIEVLDHVIIGEDKYWSYVEG
ncbi:MAG: DNA repair protein RadC [Nanoarchaeota archaeon]|jgi:DNA repair protein RadC|nr:DNA repair protein RadC [Nanoarchaeota archaeon]